jgi:hypothetical protein
MSQDRFLGPHGVVQTVRDGVRRRGTVTADDTATLEFMDAKLNTHLSTVVAGAPTARVVDVLMPRIARPEPPWLIRASDEHPTSIRRASTARESRAVRAGHAYLYT